MTVTNRFKGLQKVSHTCQTHFIHVSHFMTTVMSIHMTWKGSQSGLLVPRNIHFLLVYELLPLKTCLKAFPCPLYSLFILLTLLLWYLKGTSYYTHIFFWVFPKITWHSIHGILEMFEASQAAGTIMINHFGTFKTWRKVIYCSSIITLLISSCVDGNCRRRQAQPDIQLTPHEQTELWVAMYVNIW